MTKDEALKLARRALWFAHDDGYSNELSQEALNAIREALAQSEQNQFNPDWDAMAVMVEEQQRMAKRIAELEAQPEQEPVGHGGRPMTLRECMEAEEPASKQEPVAWLHTKIEGVAVPHRPADLDKHPDRWEALYKTPPPCPTCEALARTVMLDQTYHDAQRKPLTDEELDALAMDSDGTPNSHLEFARAIEAAHGIKGPTS